MWTFFSMEVGISLVALCSSNWSRASPPGPEKEYSSFKTAKHTNILNVCVQSVQEGKKEPRSENCTAIPLAIRRQSPHPSLNPPQLWLSLQLTNRILPITEFNWTWPATPHLQLKGHYSDN